MICSECHAVYKDGLTLVDLRDTDLYDLTCPEGHQTTVRLANEKFELLFDSGGLAVLDGYLFEAVSSFAAALERFREFYIRVIALKHLGGKESAVEQLDRILSAGKASEPLEETWKKVEQQSQRQYGAFLFLHLLETGNPPLFVDAIRMESYRGKNKQKKELQSFRNSVIHNGYIPTKPQVKEYGNHVFQFIKQILSELLANEHNTNIIEQLDLLATRNAQQQGQTPGQRNPTVLSSRPGSYGGPQNFDEVLVSLQEARKRVYS